MEVISIHAPRVGRDRRYLRSKFYQRYFNPRAPCGARRHEAAAFWRRENFNPRAPCGARQVRKVRCKVQGYFNPRAPCGARLFVSSFVSPRYYFNPRAPCGARHRPAGRKGRKKIFQSTRPVWGATRAVMAAKYEDEISIHAPRVGRDEGTETGKTASCVFQSTRPVWGAT